MCVYAIDQCVKQIYSRLCCTFRWCGRTVVEGGKARRTGRERGFAPLSTRIAQTCLSTNPPQHLRVHTINGSRRKIGGGFLGVVTAGQKGRNGCQGMVSRIGVTYTRSRGRGWFRGDPGDRLLCFFNYI